MGEGFAETATAGDDDASSGARTLKDADGIISGLAADAKVGCGSGTGLGVSIGDEITGEELAAWVISGVGSAETVGEGEMTAGLGLIISEIKVGVVLASRANAEGNRK